MSGHERRKRGALVSVEVGPCPTCGYQWKANPLANRAQCPQCHTRADDDVPTVEVPDR